MTLAEMRTELAARGFDYASSSRLTGWINRAYLEVSEEGDWPFLEATTTGTAPLTISDLRTIASVTDTTNVRKLRPIDHRNIGDIYTTLTTTGTPEYYYVTTSTTVAVYPANTANTLSVKYWKVPTALSADADTPIVPTRFQQMVIDGATAYAYFDSDNFEAGREMQVLYAEGKERMRNALMTSQHDEPDDYIVVYGTNDA